MLSGQTPYLTKISTARPDFFRTNFSKFSERHGHFCWDSDKIWLFNDLRIPVRKWDYQKWIRYSHNSFIWTKISVLGSFFLDKNANWKLFCRTKRADFRKIPSGLATYKRGSCYRSKSDFHMSVDKLRYLMVKFICKGRIMVVVTRITILQRSIAVSSKFWPSEGCVGSVIQQDEIVCEVGMYSTSPIRADLRTCGPVL